MSSYCLKRKKTTTAEYLNPRILKTKNDKAMISKCATRGSKKRRFIKKTRRK